MKKQPWSQLVFLLGLLSLPLTAAATVIAPYPVTTDTGGAFGQEHHYSVLFRGNGEAVVGTKILIKNGDENKPIDSVRLQPVGIAPTEFEVFQEFCQNKILKERVENEKCGTSDSWYGRDSGIYEKIFQKLQTQKAANGFGVELNEVINPYQTGTIVLSYRGFGFVTVGLFGRKTFDFQTLKTEEKVTSSRVAVMVDTDLYFQGKKSTIDYSNQGLEYGTMTGLGASDLRSSALSNFSSSIGGYGQINKVANQLLPGETLHVRGVFSDNWFGFYWPTVFTVLSLFVIIISSIVVISKKMSPKSEKLPKSMPTPASTERRLSLAQSALFGLLGSIGIPAGITALTFGYGWVESLRFRGDYSTYSYNPLSEILLVLIVFLLVVTFVFALPVYIGFAYRRRDGVYVFLWQILFLIFMAMVVMMTNLGVGLL